MPRRDLPPAHASIPNLAPMVDVVMVILIFFMLGTTFVLSEGLLRTQLPAQTGPGGGAKVLFVPQVRIDLIRESEGQPCRILVLGRELTENSFEALSAFLRDKVSAGADPEGRVLIAADPEVIYQHVVAAMDACIRAGLRNLQFAVGGTPTPDASGTEAGRP